MHVSHMCFLLLPLFRPLTLWQLREIEDEPILTVTDIRLYRKIAE